MPLTKKCLILAAGNGTRLRAVSANLPKPLVSFRGRPILEHIVTRAQEAGVEEFVIVLGYRGNLIRDWFERNWRGTARFTWVENPDYHKSNGISALKARHALRENFLLLMADHLFEAETARTMLQQPLARGEVVLGVDPKLDRIFDIDDATKVRRVGEWIVAIGKDLEEYDAVDTGMFLCTPVLFHDLDSATTDGNCSLSDGMRRAVSQGRLRALEIGDADWNDLDTPEALAHAEMEALEYAA
jgi:1L-myo-inositol 1-phosphate cytidylyltransferase